jgi:hypothetical protein
MEHRGENKAQWLNGSSHYVPEEDNLDGDLHVLSQLKSFCRILYGLSSSLALHGHGEDFLSFLRCRIVESSIA